MTRTATASTTETGVETDCAPHATVSTTGHARATAVELSTATGCTARTVIRSVACLVTAGRPRRDAKLKSVCAAGLAPARIETGGADTEDRVTAQSREVRAGLRSAGRAPHSATDGILVGGPVAAGYVDSDVAREGVGPYSARLAREALGERSRHGRPRQLTTYVPAGWLIDSEVPWGTRPGPRWASRDSAGIPVGVTASPAPGSSADAAGTTETEGAAPPRGVPLAEAPTVDSPATCTSANAGPTAGRIDGPNAGLRGVSP